MSPDLGTFAPDTRVDLGTDRTGAGAVVRAMAVRNLRGIRRQPATFIPTLIMPIFFVVAFSGAFGFAGRLFGNGNALSWYAPMAIIQGASFAGMTIGLSTARDFETGFMDRYLLAPMSRYTLLGGALAVALMPPRGQSPVRVFTAPSRSARASGPVASRRRASRRVSSIDRRVARSFAMRRASRVARACAARGGARGGFVIRGTRGFIMHAFTVTSISMSQTNGLGMMYD